MEVRSAPAVGRATRACRREGSGVLTGVSSQVRTSPVGPGPRPMTVGTRTLLSKIELIRPRLFGSVSVYTSVVCTPSDPWRPVSRPWGPCHDRRVHRRNPLRARQILVDRRSDDEGGDVRVP